MLPQTTKEAVKELQEKVSSRFDEGIDRLVESHEADAEALRSEIGYQSREIQNAIFEGSEECNAPQN